MSYERSPREVCSTTIGITLIFAPKYVLKNRAIFYPKISKNKNAVAFIEKTTALFDDMLVNLIHVLSIIMLVDS